MSHIRVFLYSAPAPIVEPKVQRKGTALTEFNSRFYELCGASLIQSVSNISGASVSAVAIIP